MGKDMAKVENSKFYIVNDKYEVNPSDPKGGLRVKQPAFREIFLCPVRAATTINGVFSPAFCGKIIPTTSGIYMVEAFDPDRKEKCLYLDSYVSKGILSGPFDTRDEAEVARLKSIPKTALQVEQEKSEALRKELEELKGRKEK